AFTLPCLAAAREWRAFDDHLASAASLLAETGTCEPDVGLCASLAGGIARERGELDRALLAEALAAQHRRAPEE
ncbi:MAG: hypothetical protein QME96_13545, partial [Myxococcota bacterium]|nr:hypothetical protein [Myxococcota bacterium]